MTTATGQDEFMLKIISETKTSTENLTSVVITTSDSLYSESFKWQSSTSQMLTAITTDGEEKTILDKHSGELTVPGNKFSHLHIKTYSQIPHVAFLFL